MSSLLLSKVGPADVSAVVIDLFPARKEQTTPRHLRALVSDLQLQVDLLKNSKVSFSQQAMH